METSVLQLSYSKHYKVNEIKSNLLAICVKIEENSLQYNSHFIIFSNVINYCAKLENKRRLKNFLKVFFSSKEEFFVALLLCGFQE